MGGKILKNVQLLKSFIIILCLLDEYESSAC